MMREKHGHQEELHELKELKEQKEQKELKGQRDEVQDTDNHADKITGNNLNRR